MILLEVVALAAAAAVAILRDGHSSWYLPLFFTLLTLSIVSELGALDVSGGRMKLSASFLSIVTAVVFLGETPAVLIGVATILAGWLRSRYAGHYLLVNLGIYSWFPLIAGIAFHEALDATGASRTDPLFYVLVLGAALFALAVNFTLVAGDVCYIERSRFPAVVRSALLPVLPSEVISAVLTLGIAFAYVQAGLASLALYAIVLISFQYLIGALLVSQRRGEELEHQALHDPLTGLPNRALFLDRLEQALARARRSRSGLAVMFCDLDDFKAVNDSLGHSAGDELLVALVPRLREALRAQDTVARFGGDEFVILCEDLQTVADVTNLADRIAGLFAKPLVLDGKEHFVTVSSGVVIVEGGEAEATEVLRDADAAMYRAKRRGRGGLEIFEEGMHARLLDRLRMEDELRRAISRGELFLVYQPMVSLEGGVVVGAEALLRWRHPEHERGVLSPADFIESAEESGLIVPIGEWLLEEACRQAAEWQRQLDGRPFNVSVNLSARQVAHTDIAATVSDTLRKSRLDPERLDLEITERVFIGDGHEASEALRELKDLGVGLVLDDFGTGYSSLTYLKRLPIDALKIDRSFIDGLGQDEEDTAIVVAVLGIARALKMDVIAEGVETADQLAWLRDAGCRFVQGFYVSRPVRPELLTSLLRDGFPSRAIRARTNGGALPGEAVAPLEG